MKSTVSAGFSSLATKKKAGQKVRRSPETPTDPLCSSRCITRAAQHRRLNINIGCGGLGADRFTYSSINDAGAGDQKDVVLDFNAGEGDRINLQAIGQTRSLHYIGTNSFTGSTGEVRFSQGLLEADWNGDAQTDFAVLLAGANRLGRQQLLLG